MFDEQARALLAKPLLARLAAVGPDGYPHTVPVWFMLEGDDIVFISVRGTRKVGYFQANPKGAVTIGGDAGDGGGYLVKGDVSIEEDPDDAWVRRLTHHYEPPEQAEKDIAAWADLDIILLRLRPRTAIKVA